MTGPVVVDTDVMVDYLRGEPKAVSLIEGLAHRATLPVIVVAELFAGARGETELALLDALVGLFRVAPVDAAVARAAGRLRHRYGRSHGVGIADAIVAATAEAERAELVTLNVRHYPMFGQLRPPYRKP